MPPCRAAAFARMLLASLAIATTAATPAPGDPAAPPPGTPAATQEAEKLNQLPPLHPHGISRIDRSGRKEQGRASYYAKSFDHRRMADGRRMNPNSNIAASKTLPLGTTARVINLENGKAATVKVEDRGPFVDGRVVDLSPKVASDLNIKRQGVAPVVVKPIAVPLPDGQVKLGAGAAEATPEQITQATETTKALVDSRPTETASRR